MITSPDYTGAVLVLVHADTGAPVAVGDTVTDFRGDAMTITGGRAPHKESSTGRVYVKDGDYTREYFPGVAGLAWRYCADLGRRHAVDVVRPHLPEGCAILAAQYAGPDRIVVIASREHDYHPFVVWSHYPKGCPGVHHGQYFATIEEATAAYVVR